VLFEVDSERWRKACLSLDKIVDVWFATGFSLACPPGLVGQPSVSLEAVLSCAGQGWLSFSLSLLSRCSDNNNAPQCGFRTFEAGSFGKLRLSVNMKMAHRIAMYVVVERTGNLDSVLTL
jgi:hypothetical protein